MKKKISGITIRKAVKGDANKITKLSDEDWEYHRRLSNIPLKKINKAAVHNRYKKKILDHIKKKNNFILIALHNDQIIGYFIYLIRKDKNFVYSDVGVIKNAYITNKYRSKGIGNKMFSEIIKWFKTKKIKYVELYVDSKNKIGLNAWSKYGFKENLKQMSLKLK